MRLASALLLPFPITEVGAYMWDWISKSEDWSLLNLFSSPDSTPFLPQNSLWPTPKYLNASLQSWAAQSAQPNPEDQAAISRLMAHWADELIVPSVFSAPAGSTRQLHPTPNQISPARDNSSRTLGTSITDAALGAYYRVSALTSNGSRLIGTAEQQVDHSVNWTGDRFMHAADSAAAKVSKIPLLGSLANDAAWLAGQSAQLAGGVVKGATSLLSGIGNLALHPIDTTLGLAKMVEHVPGPLSTPSRLLHGLFDVAIGKQTLADGIAYGLNQIRSSAEDAQYWRQFGGAITAPYVKSIQHGKPAEAIGRGLFDVGCLFLGAGEAKAAAKGGEAAGLAGHVERAATAAKPAEAVVAASESAARAAMPIEKRIYAAIQRLWNRPLAPEVRAELQARWQQIEASVKEIRLDPSDPGMAAIQERIDALRMQASGTAKGNHGGIVGGTEEQGAKLAQDNWSRADAHIGSMMDARAPLTLESIQEINRLVGEGLEHNFGVPGQLRVPGQDVVAGRDWTRAYLPASDVPAAMDDFLRWHHEASGHLQPIEHAAQAYQRLVSIHPFADGNGRTCRMVMDYVLQSYGLPPATLVGAEVKSAVFGIREIFGMSNITADHAVRSVTQGVERTLGMMHEAQPVRFFVPPKPNLSPRVPALRAMDTERQHKTEPEAPLSP